MDIVHIPSAHNHMRRSTSKYGLNVRRYGQDFDEREMLFWTPELIIQLVLAFATVIGMAIGFVTLTLGTSRFLVLNF